VPDLADEINTHYTVDVDEDRRIRTGLGQLELLRTQEIIRGNLPASPQRILDVGGGTGVHAEWLLADGHRVDLVEPVQRHVTHAAARLGSNSSFTAVLGDVRSLQFIDSVFDAVLLLGPLYHLVERSDRMQAWSEVRRVVKPCGVVFAAAISRFASLFDGLANEWLFEPEFRTIVDLDYSAGAHRNPHRRPGWFTTAYFHRPEELHIEAEEAGLTVRELIGVEGLAGWLQHLEGRWEDTDDRSVIIDAARRIGNEPSLLGLSAHILAVTVEPAV